jgi:hypothetical protein
LRSKIFLKILKKSNLYQLFKSFIIAPSRFDEPWRVFYMSEEGAVEVCTGGRDNTRSDWAVLATTRASGVVVRCQFLIDPFKFKFNHLNINLTI